jgi:hypothetical protein
MALRTNEAYYQWYKHVSNALLEHKNSLETLSISVAWESVGQDNDVFEHSFNLSCLRNLRILYEKLVEGDENIAQYLPLSLERLVIDFRRYGREKMWRNINHLVARTSESICNAYLAGSLPNLKRVELSLNSDIRTHNMLLIPTFRIEAFRSILRTRQVNLDVSLVCQSSYGETVQTLRINR